MASLACTFRIRVGAALGGTIFVALCFPLVSVIVNSVANVAVSSSVLLDAVRVNLVLVVGLVEFVAAAVVWEVSCFRGGIVLEEEQNEALLRCDR